MKLNLWHYLFIWITKKLLSLRYDIEITGLDRLKKKQLKKRGGVLFLPNHPAEIDPVIIMTYLMKSFKPRPLVVEHFYYQAGMNFFMKLVRAFPIPEVETIANKWKVKQVEKAFNTIRLGLERGENFLIYPSGHLKKEGYEVIGGNSFIHRLIGQCPDLNVVLLRITGLWGSGFSRAITGEVPNFWQVLKNGAKSLIKNGIFFMPKRKVIIECLAEPEDFPKKGSRLDINKYLEGWYNTYKTDQGHIVIDEPLKLVTYKKGEEVYPEITKDTKPKRISHKRSDIPDKIKKDVYELISGITKTTASKLKEDDELSSGLGLDSLDIAEVHTHLAEKYHVKNLSPEALVTIYDVMEAAVGAKEISEVKEDEMTKEIWPEEEDRPRVERPHGKTLQEAFLRSCHRMGSYAAIADEMTGILSYKRVKLAALILSFKIAKLPGKYIGIMLPASAGTYLTIVATQLAGKIPVMMNWTAGARNLNYGAELLDLQSIISSHKFLNRLETLDIGEIDHLIVTLEDIKHSISIKDKLKGLMLARKGPTKLYNKLNLQYTRETDPAIVLFTSGTETFPKAVPLSHKNLLENQKASISCVGFNKEDVFYGALPPFHSFGMNVAGLLPILSGLKVFYSPDPTDAQKMVKDVYKWKISVMCLAPSFYKNLFALAKPKHLRSVKLFVTGAEKAPKEFFEKIKSLGPYHKAIEGYGITECSPVVTICRPNRPQKGVGQPLPNVELCVIDVETQELLPKGSSGEICMSGPSIFEGYIGDVGFDPFIEINHKRWYRSGDYGCIDSEGNLLLEGRLKRFVKIGAEMVSLGALEEALLKHALDQKWYFPEDEKVALAIGVVEVKQRPELVLFTIFDVDKDRVNEALKKLGFARIIKISLVKTIKEIPMTGTGKVQFRRLNELALESLGS